MSNKSVCRLDVVLQSASSRLTEVTQQQIGLWANTAFSMVADYDAECVVRLVDESEGRQLNAEFRDKDYPTNVLSFPYGDADQIPDSETYYLGDIIVCGPVVEAEAQEQQKAVIDHLAHMIVHGTLHLCGYDHIDDSDAQQMEQLETQILAKLDIRDPY